MANKEKISAIVVTFHPRTEYIDNLLRMRSQVDLLVVVDNGSGGDALDRLQTLSQDPGFMLLENGSNLGIATALNRGILEAQRAGCRWVALFDQDSAVTEGFIATMIADFQAYRMHKNIMQIVPRYLDPATGIELEPSLFGDGGLFLTITSGSVFPMEAFERFGLFREDLFIYCVDDDYSLRIRKSGFFIGVSKNSILLHQSGHPTSRKIFGRTISTKNYRPEARYYYARNKVWILRAYGKTFPRLVVPTLREFVTIPLRIALMESSPRRKITMFARGLVDGLVGRMGALKLEQDSN